MTLLEAIRASIAGYSIVSNAGKRYKPAELDAKFIGAQAAVYNSCGITERERKGEWRIYDEGTRN